MNRPTSATRRSAGLADRLKERPLVVDEAAAAGFLDDLRTAARAAKCRKLAARLKDDGLAEFLKGVLDGSPWLRGLLVADPAMAERVLTADPDSHLARLTAELAGAVGAAEGRDAVMRLLRLYKAEAASLIALADLGGVWTVDRVVEAMTAAADATVSASVDWLLRAAAARGDLDLADPAHPGAGSGWILLAMGKHGAGELNFSSDIDLIVFYDAARCHLADPDEAEKLFVRLTRDLVRLMQERTGEGYVFRTDLRLRPDPGATAVAVPLDAALQYYESLGQNWERAAMIKARPCAGDIEAGERFLHEIAPFVWRKYMDFAALADVHAMKRQIHAHKGHAKLAVAGHNLKLGRGGIREIEFFVQTQQLITGGRHPELRTRRTLEALDRLAEGGWIEPRARDDLASAYRFLRRLEHRLQMVADEQIHSLPDDSETLTRFARFAGFADADALSQALLTHMRSVQGHYANLFEDAPTLSGSAGSLVFTGDDDDPETLETLTRMGYRQPREVTAAVRAWHFGRIPATRSARAKERLTELTPALLEALAETPNPDAAFNAFDQFVGRLPAGVQLFSLLWSNPHLLRLLTVILGTAPRLADLLQRRPRVFAGLLEPDFFDKLPGRAALRRRLDETLAEATGYEDALDRARIFGQEQVFLIGVRILSGTVSAADAGGAFTRLAEVLVDRLHELAAGHLAESHGRIAGSDAALVAMGKLGGAEMTAGSDLDLILLYDYAGDEPQSDGRRPLPASQYYIRLTQRLVAALSAPTAEGKLYDVDMRLRPSGRAGPLATHLDGFAAYQAEEAWTWEHMALTRARVISGPQPLARRIEAVMAGVLKAPRDPVRLKADIVEMRERIQREKGSDDPWEIKLVRGGLIDIEFIAQYLQLAHAADNPEILSQNTAAALAACRRAGLLTPADAEVLEPACGLYHALTQVLRLCLDGPFDPQAAPRGLDHLLCRVADLPDLARVEAHLRDTQSRVVDVFRRLLG
ncbi:glutamate-ammonia-ligase adenylyltransferase [Tepidamorphus gemmatus]|uniref:Bifunctional glutamine synthetase adenylyltransferase/adenylyl-removing enzyme n=1 Tax=Tepidamorphus gemmatus TaxID=747076 RepID=A0A4V2UYT9_9HYPH|nr:bifunctional [glutamine synthetase] adenylyltransferase/[glutamine synthetase]-adenylyl-L-tyrosine phosphorylase [Tepidamorphus gemmatus]TCT08708.1 glutamate-ammonia-ligase adenylyltransferase [Tepidamorphus gemmatus]